MATRSLPQSSSGYVYEYSIYHVNVCKLSHALLSIERFSLTESREYSISSLGGVVRATVIIQTVRQGVESR